MEPTQQHGNLSEIPVEDVQVVKQQPDVKNKMESKEFLEELAKEMSDGKIWRSSKALASKLNVDVPELDKLLASSPQVCSRPSKEEGNILYALLKRLPGSEKPNEEVQNALRPSVSEEDRYAIACLHSAFVLLDCTLQKYAMKIHAINADSFTNLVEGKNKIEAGFVLLAKRLKADISKLPKV